MTWNATRTWADSTVGEHSMANYNKFFRDNLNFAVRPVAVLADPLDLNGIFATGLKGGLTPDPQDLLAGLTVPGGFMGTRGMLRCTLIGDFMNQTGVACRIGLALVVGGTTVWSSATGNGDIANHSQRHPWRLQFWIANLDSASTQFAAGRFTMGTNAAPLVGIGALSNAVGGITDGPFVIPFGSADTFSVDTSQDFTVEMTLVQDLLSDSGDFDLLQFRRKWGVLELVGQAT